MDEQQNAADLAYPEKLKQAEETLLKQRRNAPQAAGEESQGQSGDAVSQDRIGFALSGGGIRSATFCLGVFQRLAQSELLGKIDYISSVSGGGYFASFLGRLFHRDDIKGIQDVEQTLAPKARPGLGISSTPDWKKEVFRWLRDNGRYLAPRGAGDLLLDLAFTLRSWVALQVVIVVSLLAGFLFVQLVRSLLACLVHSLGWFPNFRHLGVSWSPYVLLCLPVLLLAVSTGWAYWLIEQSNHQVDPVSRCRLTRFVACRPWVGALAAAIVGLVIAMLGLRCFQGWSGQHPWAWYGSVGVFLAGTLALVLRGCARARACRADRGDHAKQQRVADGQEERRLDNYAHARDELTRRFRWLLLALAATAALAIIDTAGQALYARALAGELHVKGLNLKHLGLAGSSLAAFIAASARWLATAQRWAKKAGARPSLLWRLLAGVAALTILALLFVGADFASQELARRCSGRLLLGAFVIALLFAWLFGQTWGFLNGSSLHRLYAARLIRAYLGASNPKRYSHEAPSLARLVPCDDISQARYWPPPTDTKNNCCLKGAPLHLVNVTINETLDARSQVQQQDRKGIGMAIGQAGISAGVRHHVVFGQDGADEHYKEAAIYSPQKGFQLFSYPKNDRARDTYNFFGEQLSLGNWTAISGAAISTGLGSRTNPAFSFLAGFFNFRLGYWWDSGTDSRRGRSLTLGRRLRRLFECCFPVQTFLIDEFTARFRGPQSRYWYLTDGGHFENTGAYELVRRRLEAIVVIDAGADPDYTFSDLGNLVRKARLDFGAEIRFLSEGELDERVNPKVRPYFGTLERLRRGVWAEEPVTDPASPDKQRRSLKQSQESRLSLAHAALAKVTYAGCNKISWLLVLKPTLTGDEPEDVLNYHRDHPSFPQESTADQFFDEAQWESYRRLGWHLAGKILLADHMMPFKLES